MDNRKEMDLSYSKLAGSMEQDFFDPPLNLDSLLSDGDNGCLERSYYMNKEIYSHFSSDDVPHPQRD